MCTWDMANIVEYRVVTTNMYMQDICLYSELIDVILRHFFIFVRPEAYRDIRWLNLTWK